MTKRPFLKRKFCRLCDSSDLISVVNLKSTPPANAFVNKSSLQKKQKLYPLELFFCNKCSHVQLLDVVEPSELFEEYVYISGTSPVFIKHFENYCDYIIEKFNPSSHEIIVDIGSNDGTLLSFFKAKGYSVLGIDPAKKIALQANKKGIKTINDFFTINVAKEILKSHSKASVITANNVFAHADDLIEITKAVKQLLSPEGIFVFEVSYLVDVLEKTLFDTIYHEHLAYHAVSPLIKFFKNMDMELIEVTRVNTHGGSIRGVVKLANSIRKADCSVMDLFDLENSLKLNEAKTYYDFASNIQSRKNELMTCLKEIKSEGKKIAAFGAPAKATTLMYEFGLDSKYIDFIVDDSPLKQGLYSPGLHIPVLPSSAIEEKKPDYLLILAWNFSESIIEKNYSFHESNGKFIIPLPKLEII